MKSRLIIAVVSLSLIPLSATGLAQAAPLVALDRPSAATDFPIAANGQAAAIFVAPGNPETVRVAAEAFAADVERVTGVKPQVLTSLAAPLPANLIVVGVLDKSPEIDKLVSARKLDASAATRTVSGVPGATKIAAACPFAAMGKSVAADGRSSATSGAAWARPVAERGISERETDRKSVV